MEYEGMGRTDWPWQRRITSASVAPRNFPSHYDYELHDFASRCLENEYPDIDTKMAAIKASASVVSIVSYSDDNEIFQGSGIIIKEDGTILTSAEVITCPQSTNVVAENLKIIVHLWNEESYEAQMFAHDFYYGLAVVKIQGNVSQLKPACLKLVDDGASFDSSGLPIHEHNRFQLRPHSNVYKLIPGNKVIALGRHFVKPYEIMAAPGEFSIQRCSDKFECTELFKATCLITKTGRGGPLVNCNGEVIGVISFDRKSTPCVPINVALKWWKRFKKRKLGRPLLGMELSNLYNPNLQVTEKFIRKFTNSYAGVFVENVKQGSSAHTVGICPNDIIVECCGQPVRSFLELYDMMWDNIGNFVKLVVIRANDDDDRLEFTMNVIDATQGG